MCGRDRRCVRQKLREGRKLRTIQYLRRMDMPLDEMYSRSDAKGPCPANRPLTMKYSGSR